MDEYVELGLMVDERLLRSDGLVNSYFSSLLDSSHAAVGNFGHCILLTTKRFQFMRVITKCVLDKYDRTPTFNVLGKTECLDSELNVLEQSITASYVKPLIKICNVHYNDINHEIFCLAEVDSGHTRLFIGRIYVGVKSTVDSQYTVWKVCTDG